MRRCRTKYAMESSFYGSYNVIGTAVHERWGLETTIDHPARIDVVRPTKGAGMAPDLTKE